MNSIKVKSGAKINLGLRILSKRKDGFHNLSTIFYPIDFLYDELEFVKSSRTEINCNNQELESENNLILKAISILENSLELSLPTKININKNIPLGAGLGGGSSNAAYTLTSLNKLYQLNLSDKQLMEYALLLGSDVPFFIKFVPSLGEGRGDILTPLELRISENILLVNPKIHISTKELFEKVEPGKIGIHPNEFIIDGKLQYNFCKNNLENDFEKVVYKLFPEILKIKEMMYEYGAYFSQLTGTGSTVYGIFKSEKEIQEVIKKLPNNYNVFWSGR